MIKFEGDGKGMSPVPASVNFLTKSDENHVRESKIKLRQTRGCTKAKKKTFEKETGR